MPKQALVKTGPGRRHWVLCAVFAGLAWLLFVHPDIIETANHSYLFLESVFSGRFLHFYEDVMAHQNTLYYINNAHYNVLVYLIFGIAELPVFLFNAVFKTAVYEPLLYFIGKLVSAAFFAAAVPVVWKIAGQLGLDAAEGRWASLFMLLWPPAFFATSVMGQYDSICLLFLLLGFLYWLRGDMLRFSLIMGLGVACKFFPMLLVIPLVLLREKRVLRILEYCAIPLWLTLPTTLLFSGRDGDMGFFNSLMVERLFTARLSAAAEIPVFPVLFALLCVVAWLWNPAEEARTRRAGLWLCLAAFGLLFLFVQWHPQWLILLAPFVVLTTFCEKRRFAWFMADIALSAGVFMHLAVQYPGQLESNLLNGGILGLATGLATTGVPGHNTIVFYYQLFPVVTQLPMILFFAALACHLLFKWPGKNGSPAARLAANGQAVYEALLPRMLWLVFGLSMAVWLVPTLFTWFKCFGLL